MTSLAITLRRVARPGADGQARLAARQIYILPTRYGIYFATALAVMLLGSLNYGSNLALAFTFLFVSLSLIGMLHTWRNLLELRIQVAGAAPVFAGSAASFPVHISERQGLARGAVGVARVGERAAAVAMDLPPMGEGNIELRSTPRQRGEYPLGRIRISSSFPLGLFRAWAYAETAATVLVYPAPMSGQGLRPSVHFVHSAQGDRGVGADDFVGLRPYRSGDSPRHLDWKALARERGLVTRQFGGDRSEEVWLDWEATGTGNPEERLGRLCHMVLEAAALDLRYGLRLPGISLRPDAGDAHKHRCLAQLALFPAGVTGQHPIKSAGHGGKTL